MKIYTHPNLPTVWIVEDDDGKLWRVHAQASGWERRVPFPGDRRYLKPHNLPVLTVGLPT